MSGDRVMSASELFDELRKANRRAVDAEVKLEQALADLREAAEVQHDLTESGNAFLQVAAGRLNFVRKYKQD